MMPWKLHRLSSWVVAWLSSSVLVLINVVTVRRAWLTLVWVTVCGRVNHFGIHPGQLSLNRVPAFLAGVRREAFTCVGWQVTLCDCKWQMTTCNSVHGVGGVYTKSYIV